MTIIQLNVPHQKAPTCWAALDEDDYVIRTARAWDVECPTFEHAKAWNSSDMSAAYVYMSVNDAARAVAQGTMGNHQHAKAWNALEYVVRKHLDEITEPDLTTFFAEMD